MNLEFLKDAFMRIFNTTLNTDDFVISTPETGTIENTEVTLTPLVNTRYQEDTIIINYNRIDVGEVLQKQHDNLILGDEDSLVKLIPKINKVFSLNLTEDDVVDYALPDVNTRGQYIDIVLVVPESSYNYIGSGIIKTGIRANILTTNSTVKYAYILNDGITGQNYKDSVKRLNTDKYNTISGWELGSNIVAVNTFTINHLLTLDDKLILKGDFNITYTDVSEGLKSINVNTLIISNEGLVENGYISVYYDELFSYHNSSNWFHISSTLSTTTILRLDINDNISSGYPVIINEVVAAFRPTSDGGFVTVSKTKQVDGLSTVVVDKYLDTGVLDPEFSQVLIRNKDVASNDIIDMYTIYDMSVSENFIDLYLDMGVSPSTTNMVPVINGVDYINSPNTTTEYGWIPIIRINMKGEVGVDKTGFDPLAKLCTPEYFSVEPITDAEFNYISTTDDRLYMLSVSYNLNTMFKEDNLLCFNGKGELLDTSSIYKYVGDIYNFKVFPDNKLLVNGSFTKHNQVGLDGAAEYNYFTYDSDIKLMYCGKYDNIVSDVECST